MFDNFLNVRCISKLIQYWSAMWQSPKRPTGAERMRVVALLYGAIAFIISNIILGYHTTQRPKASLSVPYSPEFIPNKYVKSLWNVPFSFTKTLSVEFRTGLPLVPGCKLASIKKYG